MKCPTCKDTDLSMADRLGVEIDFCPQCRGVWLDRGELDKIIERSTQELARLNSPSNPTRSVPAHGAEHGYKAGHDEEHFYKGGTHVRKRSIWQDLFD